MRFLKISLTIFLAVTVLSGCARFLYVEDRLGYDNLKFPYVRVKIAEGEKFSLRCTGPYEIFCCDESGSKSDYYSNSDIVVTLIDGMISVHQADGIPLEDRLARVTAVPIANSDFASLDGEKYRGVLDIHAHGAEMIVINVLFIEDYLRGVLPPEIGKHGSPEFEALKAQAVASRTYALSRFRKNPARKFDLVNEVADQVYNGMKAEDAWINKAIEATSGEVLLSDEELITAYYHSTCGGATENIEDVWERKPVSYLKRSPDGGYCQWSKYYSWTFEWDISQLEESIGRYLKESRRIETHRISISGFKVGERLPSGRIKILKVMTDKGDFLLFKDQIRWAFLRPDKADAILPSTNFDLTFTRDASGEINGVVARGFGNGHGVGMCQCGALGRSRSGYGYHSILDHYYEGAKIVKVY